MMSSATSSNIVVYTAIFGNYDVLLEPDIVESEVDYICFTDNTDLSSENWEIKVINPMSDPSLSNRKIKILAHEYLPDYEYSIYVDGNIKIKCAVSPLIENHLSSADLAAYRHPQRSTIFEEAQACIREGKADEPTIKNQLASYAEAGFPDSEGLSENRVIYRCHNDEGIKRIMKDWWDEVSSWAARDQLSLMFVLWKHNKEFNLIEKTVQQSSHFQIHPHQPTGFIRIIWPYWIIIRDRRNAHAWAAMLWYISRPIYYSGRSIKIISNKGISTFISKFLQKIS